jgi:Holliday junction resolvase RusA-like endonuclease
MRLVLLGLPPATNNLYAVIGNHQVLSEAGRRYHETVAAVARRYWTGPPHQGPFAVLVTYHLGGYDRDVDGSHKAILDGFSPRRIDASRSPIIWEDDRQVVLFAARKVRTSSLPYVSVVVRPLRAVPAFRPLARPAGALSFATSLIPPSTNNTYTPSARFRRKTVAARDATAAYAAGFARLAPGGKPFRGGVRLRIRYGFIADRRDVDGSHKLLLDAARGILWDDDRQLVSFTASKARLDPGRTPVIMGNAWDVPPLGAPPKARRQWRVAGPRP